MGVSGNDIRQQRHNYHSAEKFVPSGGTLYRPCRSRTDPLRPPRRSWNTHRQFGCARAATRLGESWSNTSNISGDHTRTTSACTPSEAPYRTVWSSIRTVSGPAPSPPPPRPHPQTERQRSARLSESVSHCHHFLRASFPEVPSSFSAGCPQLFPSAWLPASFPGIDGKCSLFWKSARRWGSSTNLPLGGAI